MVFQLSDEHEAIPKAVREFAEEKIHPVAREHAVDIADEALHVFGGAGYVTDHLTERYYCDARPTKSYEGTNEIQKNIIADQLL